MLQVLLKLSGVPARRQFQKGQQRRKKRKMDCSVVLLIRIIYCLNLAAAMCVKSFTRLNLCIPAHQLFNSDC